MFTWAYIFTVTQDLWIRKFTWTNVILEDANDPVTYSMFIFKVTDTNDRTGTIMYQSPSKPGEKKVVESIFLIEKSEKSEP